ncbi:MAG: YraN family protein [Rhodospirillales bacterium]|nr:YraN family protein [Rhodospirillales bacterium]
MNRAQAERRGRWAEAAAILLLRLKGYAILAQRYRTGPGTGAGEVDLIARKGNLVAFVEVKARADADRAAHSITPRQQARIARGAEAFLQAHPELAGLDARFDVVLVAPLRPPVHLENAWQTDSAGHF